MKRTATRAALLAAAALLTACSSPAAPQTTDTDGKTVARNALQELYSTEAQDSADFEAALTESATNESALQTYLTGKVGDTFSSEGLDTLVSNRVVSRVLDAWPASEVAVEEIDLQDAYTQTDEQQTYGYTVTAAPEGEDPQTFTGEITLTLTEGVWQITAIR